MNFRATGRPLGSFLWILAGSQLFPLAFALFEDRSLYHTSAAFICSILIVALLGLLLWLWGSGGPHRLQRKEGLFIVAAGWILAGVVGGIPYYVSGALPAIHDAIFESVSGFTTTGASVMTNIELLPRSVLLWRSLTHWLGGMGIIVLFVAILPSLGLGGKYLYRIEATGPAVSGIHPRAADTARTLWLIYAGVSLVEFILLFAGGMPAFDAVCHTFGTMATGGFSTKNASIGHYGTYFQVVITIFMFMAGVNFSLYYQALRRKWLFLRDAEFRFYLLIAVCGTLVMLATRLIDGGLPVRTALRDSAFTTVSILTTTGYATADFEQWSPLAHGLLILLMFIGGSAGSTGGGIKVVRVLIVLRWVWKRVTLAFSPRAVIPLKIGGEPVDHEIEQQVASFTLLFLMCFVGGLLVLLACGHDMVTSLAASIATLANIGPGLGVIGPTKNYAAIHSVAKPVLSVMMILGRLELMAVAVLFVPSFWRR